MTDCVHFLKPALRAQEVYHFQERQKQFCMPYQGRMAYPVWTSRKPRRENEMINGGSVYWIVKNQIQVRQEIWALETIQPQDDGEKPSFMILCNPELIRVQPIARRAFQGWRYLEADNAPPDIGVLSDLSADDAIPQEMESDLRSAGLL
jgi:hypothetical protein